MRRYGSEKVSVKEGCIFKQVRGVGSRKMREGKEAIGVREGFIVQ